MCFFHSQQQQQTQAGATAFAMQQQVGGVGGHVAAAVSNSSPVLHSNLQPGVRNHTHTIHTLNRPATSQVGAFSIYFY